MDFKTTTSNLTVRQSNTAKGLTQSKKNYKNCNKLKILMVIVLKAIIILATAK